MNKGVRIGWGGAVLLFAAVLTLFTLSYMAIHPWRVIPEIGGDGAKNNFTYLYHAMFGHGYWFQGMNYPYGEHIVFTDGQPVLSVLLAVLGNATAGQALALTWGLVAISHMLAIIFTWLILVHYKAGRLAALVFAGLICTCAPQLFRLQGHYALAYSCAVPMLFYWTIQFFERGQLRYCLYIFGLGCFIAFLHPYYAAMMLVWAGGYTLGCLLCSSGGWRQRAGRAWPVTASVLAVFVVVAVTMKLTDPVTDRPIAPLNTFYETCTRLRQIVTSVHSPIWVAIKDKGLISSVADGGEGYTYIGIVAVFVAILSAFLFLVRVLSKRDTTPPLPAFPVVWLFIAALALMAGMGIPFIWNMDLLDYLSIFRQFRSMGRFSWIFYYIITIYSALMLYNWYLWLRAMRQMMAAYTALLLPMLIWGCEASGYIRYSRSLAERAMYNYDMIFSTQEQSWTEFLATQGHKGGDFQAILLLRFFHIGTEKLWVGNPSWLMTLGSKASLQLGLPIVDVMMSRSSWSQAQAQVKIAAGPYTNKPILKAIKSRLPFLVLQFDDEPGDPDQQYLLDRADYLGHYSQCKVYACYPDRIAASDSAAQSAIRNILPSLNIGDTSFTNTGPWYANHMDGGSFTASPFWGSAAAWAIKGNDTVLATVPVGSRTVVQQYEFSCWFLLNNEDYRSPYVTLQLLDSVGNTLSEVDALTKESTDSHGMWFRASRYFMLPLAARTVRCKLYNSPNPAYVAMDELLLRPADALIIYKDSNGRSMVNNHLFQGSFK